MLSSDRDLYLKVATNIAILNRTRQFLLDFFLYKTLSFVTPENIYFKFTVKSGICLSSFNYMYVSLTPKISKPFLHKFIAQ